MFLGVAPAELAVVGTQDQLTEPSNKDQDMAMFAFGAEDNEK